MNATTTLEEWEAKQMQDPAFQAAAERLEPAYQAARLRMLRGGKMKESITMIIVFFALTVLGLTLWWSGRDTRKWVRLQRRRRL